MNPSIISIFFIYQLILQLISDCFCVHIVRHLITQSIDSMNQTNSIIMDCDYQYNPDEDIKLVVRWFYNDYSEPIYQWIPESDNKRYIGQSIRKYFDMNFQIGDDRFKKYRAIRLMPKSMTKNSKLSFDLELSGNYTCVISSIMNQDTRQGQLILYVPPSKFEFNIYSNGGHLSLPSIDFNNNNNIDNNDENNRPMVRCIAEGVFPKPILSFSELIANSDSIMIVNNNKNNQNQNNNLQHYQQNYYPQFKQTFPKINVHTAIMTNNDSNNENQQQYYKSWFEYRLEIDSIKVGTIFECRLEISNTIYIRKKRIKLIYPSTYLNGVSSMNNNNNNTNNQNNNNNRWSRQYPYGYQFPTKHLSDYQVQLHNQRNVASSIITPMIMMRVMVINATILTTIIVQISIMIFLL